MRVPRETSRHAQVRGVRMHARAWSGLHSGDSEGVRDVVLVHGLGVASRMCRPVALQLAGRYRVWAPDLPGFGRSGKRGVPSIDEHADYLAAWLRGADLTEPVLVGTSVGSQVAAAAAHRHPGCCDLLVLGAPTVDAGRRSWLQQLGRWPAERQSNRLRLLITADFARAGIPRVVRTFGRALNDRIEDRMPAIDQPVLVCWGTRDPLLSRAWVERLAELPRRGALAVLPGGRHALSHDSPLEFGRAIAHFIHHQGTE